MNELERLQRLTLAGDRGAREDYARELIRANRLEPLQSLAELDEPFGRRLMLWLLEAGHPLTLSAGGALVTFDDLTARFAGEDAWRDELRRQSAAGQVLFGATQQECVSVAPLRTPLLWTPHRARLLVCDAIERLLPAFDDFWPRGSLRDHLHRVLVLARQVSRREVRMGRGLLEAHRLGEEIRDIPWDVGTLRDEWAGHRLAKADDLAIWAFRSCVRAALGVASRTNELHRCLLHRAKTLAWIEASSADIELDVEQEHRWLKARWIHTVLDLPDDETPGSAPSV